MCSLNEEKKCYVEEYYGVRWVNVHNTYLGDMPPGLGGGQGNIDYHSHLNEVLNQKVKDYDLSKLGMNQQLT